MAYPSEPLYHFASRATSRGHRLQAKQRLAIHRRATSSLSTIGSRVLGGMVSRFSVCTVSRRQAFRGFRTGISARDRKSPAAGSAGRRSAIYAHQPRTTPHGPWNASARMRVKAELPRHGEPPVEHNQQLIIRNGVENRAQHRPRPSLAPHQRQSADQRGGEG